MSDFTDSAQSKQIDQQEHNSDAQAKRVVLRGQDPTTAEFVNIGAAPAGDGTYGIKTGEISYTYRYDYDSNPFFIGYGNVGLSDSATGWTITKYDLTDPNDASGKIATDVSWDDRLTGTYS